MITGSKLRKYNTLIPYLIEKKFTQVLIAATAHSNHLLAISQLVKQHSINATYLIKGQANREKIGNSLLSSLIINYEQVHWLSQTDWQNIEKYIESNFNTHDLHTFYLPEGGTALPAFAGALSLAEDILRNERQSNLKFDHIFVDAGTGLTAAALICFFNFIKKKSTIHIVQAAGSQQSFDNDMQLKYIPYFEEITEMPFKPNNNFCIENQTHKQAFGHPKRSAFSYIYQLAQREGFLTDPIYSAKLFETSEQILKSSKIKGKSLIIHSGGQSTLNGFTAQLQSSINEN